MSLNQVTRKGMPLPCDVAFQAHRVWEGHPLADALAPCQMLFDSLLHWLNNIMEFLRWFDTLYHSIK